MNVVDFITMFAQTAFAIGGGCLGLGFYIGHRVGRGDFETRNRKKKKKKHDRS